MTAPFPTNRAAFLDRKTKELSQRKREAAVAAKDHLVSARDYINRAIAALDAEKLDSVGAIALLASDEAKSAFEALESLHPHAK